MQLSHVAPVRRAVFDDPNLVSAGGLVPVVALGQRAGLRELAQAHLSVPGGPGCAGGAKVSALVAGMVAGADSIEDMDLLRHGAMSRLFVGVRAPSTLGTFLRAFTFGHVRQLDAVAARFLAGLARHAPIISSGAEVTFLDIDDTVRSTFGYAKQGTGYGYSGVKGLNALLATASSASTAPVIVATRLRKGSANSARGAARLVADSIKATRACGVGGVMVLRADSAYYGRDVIAAAARHDVRFSITARKDKAVTAAIAAIGDEAWTAIRYPHAVFDEQLQQWVSDAEVAEAPFTAFASRGTKHAVTARLIVRRVRDQNPDHVARTAQGELFRVWRL
jgi:Transposase DDE domain group 1